MSDHTQGTRHFLPGFEIRDIETAGARIRERTAAPAAWPPPNPPDPAQDRILLTVCDNDIVRWILMPAYPVTLCEAPWWFSPTCSSTVAARRPWIFIRAHSAQRSQGSCLIRMPPIRRPA